MKIVISDEYKILKKFTLENLPDFLVITGENGSGKTQLLERLTNYDIMMYPFSENGIYNYSTKLSNINFIPVNFHNYGLGENINNQYLVDRWGSMPMKYHSYLNLKRISPEQNIDLSQLITQYKKDIGFINNDIRYNEAGINITQIDLDIFNKIYTNRPQQPITLEEYIVNIPILSNDLFSTNLPLLYLQHQCRIDLGLPIAETPWDVFNTILREANFKYKLLEPNLLSHEKNYTVQLVDLENENIVDVHSLSSGEKTIMSLMLALYNANSNSAFPEVILFDEPDASLHPSMSKQMLDVLQNVFVKQKKVKVIITTHSPTTVALTPELSIYKMDRKQGRLLKEDKANAIRGLTKGLDNISIYFENRKQVFVESQIDKYFCEQIYSELKRKNYLSDSITLDFITLSDTKNQGDTNGGCTFVKDIVNKLKSAGNNTALGLIDYDFRNHGNENISILGLKKRYSIENYIFDATFLSYFILRELDSKKEHFGFTPEHSSINFQDLCNNDLQVIIDHVIKKIEPQEPINKDICRFTTINKFEFEIPKWFYEMNGHSLEKNILSKIPELNKFIEKTSLARPLITKSIKLFVELLPIEILETFKELEKK